jgi:hypothetical protein
VLRQLAAWQMVSSRVALEGSSLIGKALPHLLGGQALRLAEVVRGQTGSTCADSVVSRVAIAAVSCARMSELDHTSASPA